MGFVDFKTPWNLAITAHCLSEHLFQNVPFSGLIPGLREEVPAVELTREFFGFSFVIHGDIEHAEFCYTLECLPGEGAHQKQGAAPRQTHDIGPWLAQLIAEIPEFKVVGNSPCLLEPQD